MNLTQHQMQAQAATEFLMAAHRLLLTASQHSEACGATRKDLRDILDAMTVVVALDANFPVVVLHLRGTANDIHAVLLDMELLESRTDGWLVDRLVRAAERNVEEAKSILNH